MITTTRTRAELAAEATGLGIVVPEDASRTELFDLLREKVGTTDPSLQIDPMKAKDLKASIAWDAPDSATRYAGIAKYLTPAYAAEPKLDGCRMRMFLGATGNTLNTGRRSVTSFGYISRSDNFPHLRDAAVESLAGTILDGEIMSPCSKIQSSSTSVWTDSILNASVALVNSGPAKSVATQARFGRAIYWVFDVLAVNGTNVQEESYDDRRGMLAMIVEVLQAEHPECQIRMVPSFDANVETIEESLKSGFEGVMLKVRTGTYQPGKRSANWLKVKTFSSADAFVVGWTPGESSNTNLVGSLDLAVMEEFMDGGTMVRRHRPVAQVGNLTDEFRKAVTAEDGSLRADFYGTVIEFLGQGIGKNGRVRHAHMVRIRPDKVAGDCLADQLDIFPRV